MEMADKALDFVHDTGEKIASASSYAAEALGEKGEKLKNVEQELADCCHSYIRDNPITSLGIAVAAGFVLSRMLSGR
jgi:ElaB/YqjD/DUF883 family membrane-anchored ribosome-binding protein